MGKKLYATVHYMEGLFIDLNSDTDIIRNCFRRSVNLCNIDIYEIEDDNINLNGDFVKINDWNKIKYIKSVDPRDLIAGNPV